MERSGPLGLMYETTINSGCCTEDWIYIVIISAWVPKNDRTEEYGNMSYICLYQKIIGLGTEEEQSLWHWDWGILMSYKLDTGIEMTIKMRPLLNFVSSKVWFELGMGTPLWYIIVRGIISRGDKILFVKRYYILHEDQRNDTLYGCVSYIHSYRKIRERIKEWHLFWYDNKASVIFCVKDIWNGDWSIFNGGDEILLYIWMRNHLEDILFGTRNHLIVRYQLIYPMQRTSYLNEIQFYQYNIEYLAWGSRM